jgi:hypothetical protein
VNTAVSKFADLGLTFNKPEIEQVKLPADITLLSSEQLAEKFTALTAWADYIASQLALAQIDERDAQRKMDYAENKLLVTKMGNAARGERVTLVKAQVSVDDNVVALSQRYEEKYAYRKLMEMLLNNHERDLTLVSREITRRGSDQRAMRKDWGV